MKHLLISTHRFPEIITDNNIDKIILSVFGLNKVSYSTFDSVTYYIYLQDQSSYKYPVNQLATYLKRLYTHNYSILNSIYGDVICYTPIANTHTILPYFIDQALQYYVSIPQIKETNKLPTYL